ncbi:MAG: hypothetical protein Q9208_005008, partial [Pyrenodesmia sp. 3 TL-2023]
PRSRLLVLPDEILSSVIAFTMASDEPADLWLFVDIIRNTRAYQSLRKNPKDPWGFRKANLKEKKPASNSSRLITPWLDLLPNTRQQEHYLDWLFVNQTYPRITACGRALFFREKTFTISPLCSLVLERLELAGRTSDNLALATAYIRHVVALVGIVEGDHWLPLLDIHRFTRLQSLSVCAGAKEISPGLFIPAEPHDFASYGRTIAFEKGRRSTALIEGFLRMLGLHVRQLTFHWTTMTDAPQPPQAEPIALRDLQGDVAGFLRGEVFRRAPAEGMAVERELYMQAYMRLIREE